MIISASRRTDIPAFYSKWFINRLREGYVYVRNPMNKRQVAHINLNPEVVDCIVFWTKNPIPMLEVLEELKDYKYYFQFTLNPYEKNIEPNVPRKDELIRAFVELSTLLGRKRLIWRYDPIILTSSMDKIYHYKYFEHFANKLAGYTEKCVISFVDIYRKTARNSRGTGIADIPESEMIEMAEKLVSIASPYGITLEACSEKVNLSSLEVNHGKCIDDRLISDITGRNIIAKKDKNQRESCGCVESIDIGAYNSCNHQCVYCYANYSRPTVAQNLRRHDWKSPLLLGNVEEEDKIYVRKVKSLASPTNNLF